MSEPSPRVGLRVAQYAATWPELRDRALLAERLGFDGLWVNDHMWTPGRLHRDDAFEGLTILAALAPLTRRVRLGTVVLSASYRPPALAAKVASVLDVISDGRLVLGLGSGSDLAEHRAYGIPFRPPAERRRALEELVAVIDALAAWPDGASLPGLLDDAPARPVPVQRPRPPIWLAAHRPGLQRLAGERADGIVAAFVGPHEVAIRLAAAERHRVAAGRERRLACALYTYVLPLTPDTERWLAPEARALDTTPRALVRWLAGTGIVAPADEIAGRLAEHAAAGATDVVCVLPNRTPDEAVHALAEAALPRAAIPARSASRSVPDIGPEHNLVHLLVERHRRTGRGGDLAVVEGEREWSFDGLGDVAARAHGTLAAVGVGAGQRVVIAVRDGLGWLGAFLGSAGLRAVAVPVDPASPAGRLAEILADCEPAAVVAGPETEVPPGPWRVVDPAWLDDGPARPVGAVHEGDLAYLVYSSGSTGRPKAAMHAHGDLRAGVETYAARVLGLAPGDRCHSVARLFTSLGFGNGFFRPLGRGAAVVLSGVRPNVRSVLRTVADARVTVLTAVPTFWAQLAEFAARHPLGEALGSVRLAVSSGDSLPAAVGERLRVALGLDILEGLGCSEVSNIVISTLPGEPLPGRLGRQVPGTEVGLVDPDGRPVADGEPGRLCIRGASNTSGYWRRPDLTRALVQGEWLRMGDVLVREAGVFRHVGRVDDLFKVDAQWVSPVEVEAALYEHPAVAQAVVVGLPDERGLLRPVAYVVLAGGGAAAPDLPQALRRHVAGRLDARRAPARVEVVEALPRLPSGKVDRRALRGGA